MQREALDALKRWKDAEVHLPLLMRGARQVGKTYLIEALGAECFDNVLSINFELEPEYIDCFTSLEPDSIINQLSILKRQNIVAGKTLLFLDEIQECPRAIMALRYFKEKMPDLHVIGAGSLLEFALQEQDFRMPVGRVQYFYLRPLSFREYLRALGEAQLITFLSNVHSHEIIPIAIHQRLLYLVREYMTIGGMPAAIQSYLAQKNLLQCQEMQTVLLSTYRNDFGKYATQSQHKYLQKAFVRAPSLIGEQIKYVRIDPDMRSRDLKRAIEDLSLAGVLYPIYASKASGVPLHALLDEYKFKLLFLDVGLVKRANYLDINLLSENNLYLIDAGAMAEQFVGQEIIAYQNPLEENALYYWSRDAKSSQAEIDYLFTIGSHLVPIEVKSGKTGRMKSLQVFMAEKNCSLGVRISQSPLGLDKNVFSVPFYLIGELRRLLLELY